MATSQANGLHENGSSPERLVIHIDHIQAKKTILLAGDGLTPIMLDHIRQTIAADLNEEANQLVYLTADRELITLCDGQALQQYAESCTSTTVEVRLVQKTPPPATLAPAAPVEPPATKGNVEPPARNGNVAAGTLALSKPHQHAENKDLARVPTENYKLGYELLAASGAGCLSCVTEILRNRPDMVHYESVNARYTPLDWALFRNHQNVVQSGTESS
jgi:hypothetical protein